MNRRTGPRWALILLLSALGLVRPLISIADFDDALGGRPLGPVLVTAAIAALWVGVVVATRDPNPFLTLTTAGGLYGVFAILLQQIIWNRFLGGTPEDAPSSVPLLVRSWIAILVTNTIWGALLGLIATCLRRLLPRRGAEA